MSKKKKKTENLEDSQNQDETFDLVVEPEEQPVLEDTDTDTDADTNADTDTDINTEAQDDVYSVYIVSPGHRISVRGGVKRAGQVITASMFSQGEGVLKKLLETGGIVKQ